MCTSWQQEFSAFRKWRQSKKRVFVSNESFIVTLYYGRPQTTYGCQSCVYARTDPMCAYPAIVRTYSCIFGQLTFVWIRIQCALSLRLLTFIQEVCGSNFGRNIDWRDLRFSWFSSARKGKFQDNTKLYRMHYFLHPNLLFVIIIESFDSQRPGFLIASLNKLSEWAYLSMALQPLWTFAAFSVS
jgi:hypothetical protein